jgi:hypothetical protein
MSERKRFSVIETGSNRNQSLEERLKDFPELRAKIERMLEVVENSAGDMEKAATVDDVRDQLWRSAIYAGAGIQTKFHGVGDGASWLNESAGQITPYSMIQRPKETARFPNTTLAGITTMGDETKTMAGDSLPLAKKQR